MDKTRKQVQEQEAMKEKIRQNSKDKSNIMNMVRKIITK
jgi:hypothetical protein